MTLPRGVSAARRPVLFGLLATTGGLIAYAGFSAIRHASSIAAMLVAALFFTLGLERPVQALTRRGLSRAWAVTVLAAVLGLLLCGGLALVVPGLANQFDALLDLAASHEVSKKLNLTPQTLSKLAGGAVGGAVSLAGALFTALTTLMLTLFLLATFGRVRDGAYRFVPASRRADARRLGDTMMDKVGAYLAGAITIAVCAATAALLWCLITGVPYAVALALVVGVCDLIPQVGATIGSTVVILVALTISLPLAVATLVFFCAYQGMENWIVYPRLMSRAVKISNLAAIVSALVGGALFGILGVLIAVPAYACLQLLVRELVFPRQDAR